MISIVKKFIDREWNFDPAKFLELIKKSTNKLNNSKDRWVKSKKSISIFNTVWKKDIRKFINKLSWFLSSWMDLKTSLSIVSKQLNNPYLEKIVLEMKTNIDFWILISNTMRQYPKVFDNLTVALIAIWEKTGNLWDILNKMDQKMLEQIELKSKVKWALTYPIILLSLTFLMVIFMMTFIIPKITESFQKTWVELPALTKFVISISDFIKNDWYIIILIFVWFFFFISFIKKTVSWELMLWNIWLNIPIFSYIVKKSNVVYFINSFTLLLDSWVLMIDALESSWRLLPNIHYRREILRVKREVESWVSFSKSIWLNLDNSSWIYLNKLFEEEFAYIVNMWEETGTLSKSLSKLWNNYNWELKRYIWNLSTMLEPFILVIVWVLVWTIVIAIMLPFFNIWKVVQNS